MTAPDVDALEAARAAATAGPWEMRPYWFDQVHAADVVGASGDRITTDQIDADDAALIVAAVNALPELLAEIRRLRALLAAVDGGGQ